MQTQRHDLLRRPVTAYRSGKGRVRLRGQRHLEGTPSVKLTRPRSDGHKIMVMPGRKTAVRSARRSRRAYNGKSVAAAEFKVRCLELIDRVRETGTELVVTKHGKPVAKVVPFRVVPRIRSFGSMKGTVLGYDRPFDPIDDEWDINRD